MKKYTKKEMRAVVRAFGFNPEAVTQHNIRIMMGSTLASYIIFRMRLTVLYKEIRKIFMVKK